MNGSPDTQLWRSDDEGCAEYPGRVSIVPFRDYRVGGNSGSLISKQTPARADVAASGAVPLSAVMVKSSREGK
jgi:hypothetical protein